MNLKGIDLVKLSKLASQQIEHITCLECCKYYIVPETAACSHTLCHNCWRGRKTCPLCTKPVDRKQIKINLPIQKLTEHVQLLAENIEKLFNLKLDEFLLDTGELEPENDPTKNVKDWLASSQNQFSAPAQSSDPSSQDPQQNSNSLEVSSSKIQVHTATRKTISPEKVVHVSIPQDDWDKIETMPATEVVDKNKENIIGPMDIEPFYFDDNEYSVNNPRRSSRKRELKNNDSNLNRNNNSIMEKENPKDSSGEMDKKSSTTKQNWNNVKKMRKEFSKLNKMNRSKLNVSIEMCKKTQSTAKPNTVIQNINTPAYEIDENTPQLTINDLPDVEMRKVNSSHHSDYDEVTNPKEKDYDKLKSLKSKEDVIKLDSENLSQSVLDQNHQKSIYKSQMKETTTPAKEAVNDNQGKMLFYKKGALGTSDVLQTDQETKQVNTINHNIESNSNSNDDIEITIKVGNTITNIVIKKKEDIQLKVNTDREVQTSLCPQELNSASQKVETRNVSINIDSNNKVNIEHRQITEDKTVSKKLTTPKVKNSDPSIKSMSGKKNTASADTGTGQFEITESVEKELSNIMECAELEDQHKTKSVPNSTNKVIQQSSPKPQSNPEIASQKKILTKTQLKNTQILNTPDKNQENLSYLNDLDIFESDTVKETNVQPLKYAKNTTPSEILISTAHNRNKTQKSNEKRDRGDAGDLPASKKQKLNDTNESVKKQVVQKQPDSEPMNYESIMGQVFASIDADMEEIKSQNIVSQKLNENALAKTQKITQSNAGGTEKQDGMSVIDCTLNTNDFNNPKDSENIFSVCVEKEDSVEATAPKPDKVPLIEPQPNIDDFLTPVLSRNQESSSARVESQIIEIGNDDSESVVEDTPQKTTSFSKIKQKSITTNHNSSQRINATESRVHSGKSSDSEKTKIVNLETEVNNVTIIDNRKTTLETPLTINKFVNHIQHNSTPVARKSLNFESENIDDPEQTLCPTSDVAKTTQEKEFMRKAFEKTPTTQVVRPMNSVRGKRFCLAGSCLSSSELAKVKALCALYKWSFADKYTRDLTHLVVGVDEENKSQRSVKYMCALAASKWIVSNEWVEKCLETKHIVGEERYEALDSTGEPGPRRSRVANKKLFQGITFYCMEPFSVLDVNTLKEILESSGGRVVSEVKDVRVSDKSTPAILLAEPENTQEDRFIYLAMELSIVPVNYEWVLNCLGSYTLGSVQELLLCPFSLLPKATSKWPQELIARDYD